MCANSDCKSLSPSTASCKNLIWLSLLFYIKYEDFIYRTDSEEELSLLQRLCKEEGAFDAVVCSHWASGSKGAADLAEAVAKAAEQPSNFR